MCTANNIGDEGAKGLGEALKCNTTITTLDLNSMNHELIFGDNMMKLYIEKFMYVQVILLVLKELKYWGKH